jgi:type IV pilus assembly protein PilE
MTTPRAPRRRPRTSGFTLIELMISIAIVGVMAGLALPNIIESIQRQQAIASEKEVADFIVRARNFARTTGCETRVTVDNSSALHTLTYQTTATVNTDPCFTIDGLQWTADDAISLSVWVLDDGSDTTPTGTLTFNTQGGTDETQETVLTVSNSFGTVRVIEVWPLIGSVNVEVN